MPNVQITLGDSSVALKIERVCSVSVGVQWVCGCAVCLWVCSVSVGVFCTGTVGSCFSGGFQF